MKTFKMKTIVKNIGLIAIIMVGGLFSNTIHAQNNTSKTVVNEQLTVKGIVSDDKGVLPGVNIVLKGDRVGTITDKNGAFTFPKTLSSGDVLVFSFLGYEKQEIKINAQTTFINLMMSSDLVEIMGAPNSNTPYKSKRSK
ncbi:carboxypeptidase-like regulatory domain-containing protein [Psychroserpens sp. S379A]|uniref:carboxypeptidase-like regulatory domain-containing protein n=1 Tax=Psychroserpens sp. S379A TaxID=3415137 RepID=UPI003C7B7045